MPTTERGLVYPTADGHTRLWEHLQALADTAEAALDALDKVPGTYTPRTTDASFGTSDATILTAPDVVLDGNTRVKITIDYFGITPNAGVTTGRVKIQENGGNVKSARFVTDAALTSEGGSLSTVRQPAAGTYTYTFVAIRESGPAGSVVAASAGAEASITVEQFR